MCGFKNRYRHTLLGGFTPLEKTDGIGIKVLIENETGKRRRSLTGFTLIEILVILGVISILTGLIMNGGIAAKKRARIYQARTMIASLETALALYHVDFGAYPAAGNQNLVNFLADTATYSSYSDWHGPYMSFKENDLSGSIPATLIDPWQIAYYYTMDSILPYKIWSGGPDQTDNSGNNDDIKSW
ncbi:MAG: type II secretion system protein GspG [Candidatus Omnitrophica bacterium]|nr:type II secretion system protein GspG [Candidatus Omnitrophota bacterium]